jgi:predicted ATPase with chaperone activity
MDVPRVDYEKLASDRAGESSEAVRQRVLVTRERQLARFDGSGLTCNADTPALRRRRSRAVQVWARCTSANTANWTTPAKR